MLTSASHRGFTLVEMILATVITVITIGAVFHALFLTQRGARRQGEQLRVQSGARAALLAVLSELRELSTLESGAAAENDLLSVAAHGLTYRAMRGSGLTCQPSSANQLRISQSTFSGFRDPQPGRDSILLYLDSVAVGKPGWVPAGLAAVSTASRCPDNLPAITLTVAPVAALAGKPAGIPVRTYELMELRSYSSEGHFWLGARSISAGEAIQPLFGPLTDAAGFELTYLSKAGTPTTNPSAVRSIGVTLRATSELSAEAEEQLTAEVALRNAAEQ